jgi:hypothetical protein
MTAVEKESSGLEFNTRLLLSPQVSKPHADYNRQGMISEQINASKMHFKFRYLYARFEELKLLTRIKTHQSLTK